MESGKLYLVIEYDEGSGSDTTTIMGAFTEFERAVEMGQSMLKKNTEENSEYENSEDKYGLQYFVGTCLLNPSEPKPVDHFFHKIKLKIGKK